MPDKKNRAIGAFLGLALGDAVGTTVEFRPRDSFAPLTDMVGGGPFNLKPGEWTDDTSMALCLAQSLLHTKGELDPRDLLARFTNWYRHGLNSVTGECFDIGNATRAAIAQFERTGSLINNPDEHMQANGSIMRLAPAVICAESETRAIELARAQGRTTHAAAVPDQCCNELARDIWAIFETGTLPLSVIAPTAKPRSEIISTGHAPATLEAARWAVATTRTFREAVLAAANLGDDADTVGAVTGQIAGALYGVSNLPSEWLEKLAWRHEIENLGEALWELRQSRSQEIHN